MCRRHWGCRYGCEAHEVRHGRIAGGTPANQNVFSNGVTVYLSFSGGKDSLVLADIILKMIHAGEVDPKLLIVLFIDEEAIYASVEQTVLEWRTSFLWWALHSSGGA